MDLCVSILAKYGPDQGSQPQGSKKRRMGSGNELEEGEGCLILRTAMSYCHMGIPIGMVAGINLSDLWCRPIITWPYILGMRDRRCTTNCYH